MSEGTPGFKMSFPLYLVSTVMPLKIWSLPIFLITFCCRCLWYSFEWKFITNFSVRYSMTYWFLHLNQDKIKYRRHEYGINLNLAGSCTSILNLLLLHTKRFLIKILEILLAVKRTWLLNFPYIAYKHLK